MLNKTEYRVCVLSKLTLGYVIGKFYLHGSVNNIICKNKIYRFNIALIFAQVFLVQRTGTTATKCATIHLVFGTK